MEEQPPLSLSSASSENHSNPSDAVIFFGLSLTLGIACRHFLRGTRVPYTVALLILGIVLGSLEFGTNHRLGKIGDGIRLWSEIDPELLLAVFLPALLFESAFSMEVHQIKRCIAQMILLGGPGVVISTVFLGSLLKLTFPYNWSWKTSLLLGGLLGATDPVAVIALLKDLGASKKLSTIIEGESLMNDGVAIVVYTLFYRMVLGETFNWVAIIKFLAQVSLGAVGIGIAFGIASVLWLRFIFNDTVIAFGIASVLWLRFIFNDTVIEISLTLAVSYVAYYTAQESADVSGVLTVMSLGMFYSAFARTAFKGESQKSLHHFWNKEKEYKLFTEQ
ncbi:sodium/hydrogen exchanger 7-like protein [Trifolium pratense]|uniref:Sodium/hydrogen exchanger 7-like protein n=1 Tax=Trifolium pratense TaxID=57577 RepID=A0A2K3P5R0_TRIPR|nr:sodium/hydrogen exchanger 7-like protein [Trifolium pratense]